MNHTPAPWKVKGISPSLKVTANGYTVATIIATSKADNETKTANARLIAAAPEMLAALEIALENTYMTHHIDQWYQDAQKLISEAKG